MKKDQGPDWDGATANSKITGVSGLYGLYAEAYRRAAERRGVLPREMQSITWEAIRELFPAKYKTKENVNKINNIWNRYQKGAITLDQTRQEILDASPRGFQAPAWAGPRSGATGNTGSTVTRKNYLEYNYPDGIPTPWTAELEAQLPAELQQSAE